MRNMLERENGGVSLFFHIISYHAHLDMTIPLKHDQLLNIKKVKLFQLFFIFELFYL